MATMKGSDVWVYFTKDDHPNKAKCKICKKCLASQRNYNLKQHLKYVHQIEIRLSRKRGLEHNDETCESSEEDLLDQENINLSEIISNKLAKKTETSYQCNIKKKQVNVNPKATTVEISTYDVSTHDEGIIVPLTNSKENGWLMLKERNKVDFDSIMTKSSMLKSRIIPADNFEQMIKKRKLSELECLEMRNYKMKLQIWEIEQKLQLQSSKFTKNIISRRKRQEHNEE